MSVCFQEWFRKFQHFEDNCSRYLQFLNPKQTPQNAVPADDIARAIDNLNRQMGLEMRNVKEIVVGITSISTFKLTLSTFDNLTVVPHIYRSICRNRRMPAGACLRSWSTRTWPSTKRCACETCCCVVLMRLASPSGRPTSQSFGWRSCWRGGRATFPKCPKCGKSW